MDHRLRLVQVCLDIPAPAVMAEVALWRRASGCRWVASDDDAFAGKLDHDRSSPVQLLLRALGDDDADTSTRARIDIGVEHLEPAVRRLVELGAARGPTGSGWVRDERSGGRARLRHRKRAGLTIAVPSGRRLRREIRVPVAPGC